MRLSLKSVLHQSVKGQKYYYCKNGGSIKTALLEHPPPPPPPRPSPAPLFSYQATLGIEPTTTPVDQLELSQAPLHHWSHYPPSPRIFLSLPPQTLPPPPCLSSCPSSLFAPLCPVLPHTLSTARGPIDYRLQDATIFLTALVLIWRIQYFIYNGKEA